MTHDQAITLQYIIWFFLALDAVAVLLFFLVVWGDMADGKRRKRELELIAKAEKRELERIGRNLGWHHSTLDDIAPESSDHCPYCHRPIPSSWHDQYQPGNGAVGTNRDTQAECKTG